MSTTARRFEGKVALITGGGAGFGKATGLRLASEGASIALADVLPERAAEARDEVIAQGGKALAITCDVSKEADNKRMVEETVAQFGRLDVLFTSAGIHGGGGNAVECPVEVWEKVIGIDLKGPYLGSKYAIPEMRKVGGGAIVHVSSIGGWHGSPKALAFNTAKGGLLNLTRSMAVAHAAENIRVNCICPGVVKTALTEKWLSDPKTYAEACKRHPMNRIGTVEEIAATVAFLASDEASFITGVLLPVDGGHLAG